LFGRFLFNDFPAAVGFNPLRKRPYAAKAGAFYVYKKNEILFLYQMKVGGCNGLIKGGGFAGIH
jgi:hypothetical protein